MQSNFSIEKALRIIREGNDTLFVDILFGSAAPGGDSGALDAAPIGSLYLRQNGLTSAIYQKTAATNALSDWAENGSASAVVGSWREPVKVVTNDTQGAGVRNLTTTPFADDEGTLITAADFTAGDYIISDADGTPLLLEVTLVASPLVTFAAASPALAANNTFVCDNYLPDSPGTQEGKAIVNYNGSVIIKLGDIDWNLATGINLSGGYAAASGNPVAGDSVEAAIQKVDGNNDAQDSTLGTAQGATNLGTFTGATIPDNSSVKSALQSLETAHEEVDQNVNDLITLSGVAENSTSLGTFTGDIIPDSSTVKAALQSLETELVDTRDNVDDLITLSGVAENAEDLGTFTGTTIPDNVAVKPALQALETALEARAQVTGVTALTTIDSVLVDNVKAAKWFVHVFEEANPADCKAFEVFAVHDGTASADATDADHNVSSNIQTGAVQTTVQVDVSGAGGAQVMRLRISSSTAGITVTTRRVQVA